jgi:subtilisin-like proprotein convertase family protein
MIALSSAIPCGTILSFDLYVTGAEGGPFHSVFTEEVGQSLTPAGLPGAINDNATTTSTLAVGQSSTLTDVNVHVQIQHTYVGDLKIQLQSPLGTVVTLLDRPGVPASTYGCSSDDMDITFDDASGFNPESYCPATTPWYVGPAMPVTPLSVLNGQNSSGTWSLIVSDMAGGDTGSLLDWDLITTPVLTGICNVCTAATASPIVSSEATSFGLAPVRPNPFGSSAEIAFTLDREGKAKLEIIDVTGRRVTTLLDREMSAGRHAITWNGSDSDGQPVAAGLYFVRLVSGGRTDLERVSRLR